MEPEPDKTMNTVESVLLDAHSEEYIPQIRTLFELYEASVDADLCFQEFEAELASLPGAYAPPTGCLLMALIDKEPAGCVALRRLDNAVGEMKRLFVLPEFQGQRLGRILVDAIIERAREMGYRQIRLDTLPSMERAISMYESLGFVDIEPYYSNPVVGARYLELVL